MEINGIPNSISDDNLESTVINVLSKATNVHVTADDIETCHGIGNSKGNSLKLRKLGKLIGSIANLP